MTAADRTRARDRASPRHVAMALLAVLSLVVHGWMPLLHQTAAADGQIVLCTTSGIQLVSLAEFEGRGPTPAPAGNKSLSCPLCVSMAGCAMLAAPESAIAFAGQPKGDVHLTLEREGVSDRTIETRPRPRGPPALA